MKQTIAPKTPSPTSLTRGGPSGQFVSVALNMSWQMAVVVLVPVVAGYKLDQKFNSSPALTLVGFALAVACAVIVLKHQLKVFGYDRSAKEQKS